MRVGGFDLAEISRERKLLLASQRLLREDDDVVGEQRLDNRIRLRWRHRLRQVDAAGPDAARRRQSLRVVLALAINNAVMTRLVSVIHGGLPIQDVDGRGKSRPDETKIPREG